MIEYDSTNVQIFLHKGVMRMDNDDWVEGRDIRTTLIPEAEWKLMLNDLNEELCKQDLLFSDCEQEFYYDEELQHAAKVLEKYKDRLPTVYREVKKAADLGTAIYINF